MADYGGGDNQDVTLSPEGEQAPADQWNWGRGTPAGTMQGYPPGVQAPRAGLQFNTGTRNMAPSPRQQAQAIAGYGNRVSSWQAPGYASGAATFAPNIFAPYGHFAPAFHPQQYSYADLIRMVTDPRLLEQAGRENLARANAAGVNPEDLGAAGAGQLRDYQSLIRGTALAGALQGPIRPDGREAAPAPVGPEQTLQPLAGVVGRLPGGGAGANRITMGRAEAAPGEGGDENQWNGPAGGQGGQGTGEGQGQGPGEGENQWNGPGWGQGPGGPGTQPPVIPEQPPIPGTPGTTGPGGAGTYVETWRGNLIAMGVPGAATMTPEMVAYMYGRIMNDLGGGRTTTTGTGPRTGTTGGGNPLAGLENAIIASNNMPRGGGTTVNVGGAGAGGGAQGAGGGYATGAGAGYPPGMSAEDIARIEQAGANERNAASLANALGIEQGRAAGTLAGENLRGLYGLATTGMEQAGAGARQQEDLHTQILRTLLQEGGAGTRQDAALAAEMARLLQTQAGQIAVTGMEQAGAGGRQQEDIRAQMARLLQSQEGQMALTRLEQAGLDTRQSADIAGQMARLLQTQQGQTAIARMQEEAATGRTQMQETGATTRQQANIAAEMDRLRVEQGGRMDIAQLQESGAMERQQAGAAAEHERTILQEAGLSSRQAAELQNRLTVEREQEAGATHRTELQETGATGRAQLQETGATGRTGLQETGATHRTELQEAGATGRAHEANLVNLADRLFAMSNGPNGPRNRDLALRIYGMMGIQPPAGGGGAGFGGAPGPALPGAYPTEGMTPAQWQTMTPQAKQLMLTAYEANGGNPQEILTGAGVQGRAAAGAGVPGGFDVTNPMTIAPWMWDALPETVRQEILNAYEARGGATKDFLSQIDAQRPQGRRAAGALVRYANPVAA